MITTNRTVTVGNQESTIDYPIILYRGDRDVDVEFIINGSKFMFSHGGNVIYSTKAAYGQLVINTPTGDNMFSKIEECNDGKVIFTITKEMIDELVEIGFYSFQIRLFDTTQVSRVTIPPIYKGIDIRNPIAAEDETNVVNVGLVGYSIVKDGDLEDFTTFLSNGDYNRTYWESGEAISTGRMNKIEDAIFTINGRMDDTDLALINRTESVNQTLNARITSVDVELSNRIDEMNRTLNADIDQLEVDMNSADANIMHEINNVIKPVMSEEFERVDNEIELIHEYIRGRVIDGGILGNQEPEEILNVYDGGEL